MATTATSAGLYHEVRGTGPAVLMIPGATGDAGPFTRAAERLSDEFTVISYDRRGNSRSRATGDPMAAATMRAQADDAATLIRSCGFDKAVIYGNSGGAIITLELLARQPAMVKGAIVHEPPLMGLLPQHGGPTPLEAVFELARTDPRGALDLFLRVNAGKEAWEAIEPETRERMLGNAETLFAREIGQFIAYLPDEAVLRSLEMPVIPLFSRDGLEFAPYVQSWLEARLSTQGGTLTGGHSPFFDMPEVFAEELRPMLRKLWS
jgi:pimeloyl-ACP methyl ester carboxylesterase